MIGKKKTVIGQAVETKPMGAETPSAIPATESPLDYMLRVMRDASQDDARRDAMAKAALPYMHARLTSVENKAPDNDGGQISFVWQQPQK